MVVVDNEPKTTTPPSPPPPRAAPLSKTITVAAIAAGIQFGWALQLSLLTPYVQMLGVNHTWAAFIWLCGPISGLIVQPIVGYYSDNCTSRFGRRSPFIAAGTALVAVAVFLIGFAADLGRAAGDPFGKGSKPRSVAVFVVGFWILDVANNMLQGPCRALLADLSAGNPRKVSTSNALFAFFLAIGNILGYAASSYTHLYKLLPFSQTTACDIYCANLKTCFLISITLLLTLTVLALTTVSETPLTEAESPETLKKRKLPVFGELLRALKHLPKPMWILMLVTCFNWIAWFPFLLFDTDWMGKEVYGGTVGDSMYDRGVRAGALGLLLNSVVLGVASLGVQFSARGLIRVNTMWGVGNFVLAVCLGMTVVITKVAEETRRFGGGGELMSPEKEVKVGALVLFSVLGIPLSVTFIIPYALASIYSSNSGSGQGLSLGILNLAAVIPQLLVSVTSGPWDELFGGGNLPAFVVGAVAAGISGVLALTILPSPPAEAVANKPMAAGGSLKTFHLLWDFNRRKRT